MVATNFLPTKGLSLWEAIEVYCLGLGDFALVKDYLSRKEAGWGVTAETCKNACVTHLWHWKFMISKNKIPFSDELLLFKNRNYRLIAIIKYLNWMLVESVFYLQSTAVLKIKNRSNIKAAMTVWNLERDVTIIILFA